MPTINDYKKVLNLVGNENISYSKIFWVIAEIRPDILLKAYEIASGKLKPEILKSKNEIKKVHNEAILYARHEGKVSAIKYLRSELGLGLKEAKELIESLTTDFKRS